MRNLGSVISLLMVVVVCAGAGAAKEVDSVYPNELSGYRFHARANWRMLQPLTSREAEVTAALGILKPGGYSFERSWFLTVYYWGDGGSCDGVPFPSFLVDTVAKVELIPKARVSFLEVRFPSAFHQSIETGAHEQVGTWQVYRDGSGLEYRVYDKASSDGVIHAGDLKSIVYGPSRKAYVTMTGCTAGADE